MRPFFLFLQIPVSFKTCLPTFGTNEAGVLETTDSFTTQLWFVLNKWGWGLLGKNRLCNYRLYHNAYTPGGWIKVVQITLIQAFTNFSVLDFAMLIFYQCWGGLCHFLSTKNLYKWKNKNFILWNQIDTPQSHPSSVGLGTLDTQYSPLPLEIMEKPLAPDLCGPAIFML